MTERRVSVRLAATGGDQVKSAFRSVGDVGEQSFERMSREVREARDNLARFAASGGRVEDSARRMSRRLSNSTSTNRRFSLGVQNASFQVADFAVQVDGGTSAARALGQQLPQLLGGFGVFGAVAGAAVAILAPLAAGLFKTSEAADEASEALDRKTASLESVRGSISQLKDLQETFVGLLEAQAGASATGSAALIANTQREFEARKQLLDVEVQILTLRSQDQRQALNNLRDQNATLSENVLSGIRNTSAPTAAEIGLADIRGVPGAPRIGPDPDNLLPGYDQSIEQLRSNARVIQQLEAELVLLGIASDEAREALEGVFDTPADVAGAGTAGSGGGGRSSAAREIEDVKTEIEETIVSTERLRDSLGQTFAAIVVGSQSAEQALGRLLTQMAEVLANRAFSGLFGPLLDGLFGGGLAASLFGGSFEGGGFTGTGPRAGGLDGRGGFMAMLHPNETVIDHTRSGAAGGAVNVNLAVDMRYASRGAAEELSAALPGLVDSQVVPQVLSALRRGRR